MKQLRRIAETLPGISQNSCYREKCKGSELIKDGILIVNEAPVHPDGDFIKRVPVAVPVNHKRRMKKMMNKYGQAGVSAYVRSVNNFAASQAAKEAEAQ